MSFSSGEEVRVKKANLVGRIVRERLDGEGIYLVHIEDQYVRAAELEPMSQSESEQEKPLERNTKEWFEEQNRLSGLVQKWGTSANSAELRSQIWVSLGRLGLAK
jgi:hypothetical protein